MYTPIIQKGENIWTSVTSKSGEQIDINKKKFEKIIYEYTIEIKVGKYLNNSHQLDNMCEIFEQMSITRMNIFELLRQVCITWPYWIEWMSLLPPRWRYISHYNNSKNMWVKKYKVKVSHIIKINHTCTCRINRYIISAMTWVTVMLIEPSIYGQM